MRDGTAGVLWACAAVALTMCTKAGSTPPPAQLSTVAAGPLTFAPTNLPVPSLQLPTTHHVGSLAPAPGLGWPSTAGQHVHTDPGNEFSNRDPQHLGVMPFEDGCTVPQKSSCILADQAQNGSLLKLQLYRQCRRPRRECDAALL